MSRCRVFVLFLSLAVCYHANADVQKVSSELEILAHEEFKILMNAFLNENLGDSYSQNKGSHMLGSFSYKNCEDPSKEMAVIQNMSVKPDPLKLPGNLSISVNSIVKKQFGAPLQASLDVYKKFIGLWIKVPCVDNVGSCTYKDICAQMAKLFKTCPPILVKQGFHCKCPVAPMKLSLQDYQLPVKAKIPSIADGEVKVKVELKSANTLVTCVEVEVKLE